MKRKLVHVEDSESEGITNTLTATDRKTLTLDAELPWPRYHRHDQDASIVFVGPRATGTSSLAVIAGSILGWKVIDCDGEFEKITGSTKQQFRSNHGAEQYRQRKLDVVKDLLQTNTKRCVFAWGTVISPKKNDFFMRYAREHPVVYIMRDRKSIQDYLGLSNDGAWENALEHMHLYFRQQSNYEFFNLDEVEEPKWQTTLNNFVETLAQNPLQAGRPQVLRKSRAHVATLLRNIFGSTSRTKRYGDIRTLPESDPELRQGAMACCLDLNELVANPKYLDAIDTGADAAQLNVTGSAHAFLFQDTLAWAIAALRRKLDIPIIVHVPTPRLPSDSTISTASKSYGLLQQLILRLAPEYLTVDLRSTDQVIREVVRAKGLTRIIGYLHVNHSLITMRTESILSHYHRARELGCDVVSFSGTSDSVYDNIVCQQLSHSITQLGLGTPALVYNVGPLGRLSQVFNPLMTPVVPDVQSRHTPQDTSATAGLTSARQIRLAWHMLIPVERSEYYVIGAEVRQSLSPALHNAGFQSCGLPFNYQTYESKKFSCIQEISSQASFGGASISRPFKVDVLAIAAKHSPAVQRIGAANTLLPLSNYSRGLEDGYKIPADIKSTQLIADNTDWMGIQVCIAKHCTPANHATKESAAIVIGAGGMARAAIYALVRLGFGHIFLLNRTLVKAVKLKEHFERTCVNLEAADAGSASPPPHAIYDPTFHVLESSEAPWPAEFHLPSVIVRAIPTLPTGEEPEWPPKLPQNWFDNPTGGLVANVGLSSRLRSSLEFLTWNSSRGNTVKPTSTDNWRSGSRADGSPSTQSRFCTSKAAHNLSCLRDAGLPGNRCLTLSCHNTQPRMAISRAQLLDEYAAETFYLLLTPFVSSASMTQWLACRFPAEIPLCPTANSSKFQVP
jgi:shikimate 5-dehydrogenase/shikimate kinase